MEIVENIGGHAGHNAREFFHPHSFAVDSKGNLFIGEVNDGQRYYRYAFKGMGPCDLDAMTRVACCRRLRCSPRQRCDCGRQRPAADDRSLRPRHIDCPCDRGPACTTLRARTYACRRDSSRIGRSVIASCYSSTARGRLRKWRLTCRTRTTAGWHSSRERDSTCSPLT